MPTYLPGSGSININGGDSRAINNIFGPANGIPAQGNNLLAYVGVRWYKADASTGVFAAPVTIPGDFYGKGPISPVTGGNYSLGSSTDSTSSATFTVPLYSVMTVTLRGGGGGGGGGDGNDRSGGNGNSGRTSSFAGGSYGSPATGGTGGTHGAASSGPAPSGGPTSDGNPPGGTGGPSAYAGYGAGQPGGAGGKSVLTLYNPVPGNPPPYGPPVGASINVQAGGGGSGGSSGRGISPWPWYPYFIYTEPGGGSSGSNGSVYIEWS